MLAAAKPKRRSRLSLPRSRVEIPIESESSVQQKPTDLESRKACDNSGGKSAATTTTTALSRPSSNSQVPSSANNPRRSAGTERGVFPTERSVNTGAVSSRCAAATDIDEVGKLPCEKGHQAVSTAAIADDAARVVAPQGQEQGEGYGRKSDGRARGPLQSVQLNTMPETVVTVRSKQQQQQQRVYHTAAASREEQVTSKTSSSGGLGIERDYSTSSSKDSAGAPPSPTPHQNSKASDGPSSSAETSDEDAQGQKQHKSSRKRLRPARLTTQSSSTPLEHSPPPPAPLPPPPSPPEFDNHGTIHEPPDGNSSVSSEEVVVAEDLPLLPMGRGEVVEEGGGAVAGLVVERSSCGSRGVGATVVGKERSSAAASVNSSGERCPVCGSAVWGLSVRARQVHINSCLDQATSRGGLCQGTGEVDNNLSGSVETGRAGTATGPRSSIVVAKKPKTEFQEHIQMAKALSKSLVVTTATAANSLEEDEGLEMDPASFRAKEEGLVGALKALDAKLERLRKERDAALKRLAAHRALGASVAAAAAPGRKDFGAPKTAEEVVGALFPDAQEASLGQDASALTDNKYAERMAGGDDTGKESSVVGLCLEIDPGGRVASGDEGSRSLEAAPGTGRSLEGDGNPRTCGRGCDERGGAGGGAATLTRRRFSGGRYGGRSGQGSSRGRTFWGIAQEADELSQSNFVTGVFADIRAEAAVAVEAASRRRETGESRAPTVNVAAAYGDASMYRRRSHRSSAGVASPATTPVTHGDHFVVDLSPSSKKLSRGKGSSAAAVEAGGASSRDGNEMAAGNDEVAPSFSSSPPASPHFAEDGGTLEDDNKAAVDAVLLLSQTLSGQHPTATANAAVQAVSVEEETIAARHIACAPVAAVMSVFPDWEENVRFVFGQGAPELRYALQSIDTALSEEEAAAANLQEEGTDAGGGVLKSPACRSGKAEALLFFEGVILEALELRASEYSAAMPPGKGDDEGSGGADTCGNSVGGGSDYSGCGDLGGGESDSDGEEGVHLAPDDTGNLPHARVADGQGASGTVDGDASSCGNGADRGRWDGRENHPSVAGAMKEGEREGETLDTMLGGDSDDDARASGEKERDADKEDIEGGSRDVDESVCSTTGAARAAAAAEAENVETIVLSGDSCRDAIVTFDLTNSEPGKDSTATAYAASPGAEPPDSQDGSRGAGRDGRDLTDAVAVADGATISDSEHCSYGLQDHDDPDGLGDHPSMSSSPGVFDETDVPGTLPSSPSLLSVPSPDARFSDSAPQPRSAPPTSDEDDECDFELPFFCRPTSQPPALAAGGAAPVGASETSRMQRRRGGAVSSLSQRAPARPSRNVGDVAETAAPVMSRSQPVGVRHAPRSVVSLEEGAAGGSSTASSTGGSGRLTPEVMPSFQQMTLEELVGMMSVYGLKKKPKRDMVDRLERIWKALHPGAADPETEEARCETGVSGTGDGDTLPFPAVPSGARRGSTSRSQGRTEEVARSATTSTTGYRRPPHGRQPPPSSGTQRPLEGGTRDKEALGERMRAVITANAKLHEDILLLKTVELSATQQLLKDAGVKCSKRDLGLYMDEKGITFVDRGGGLVDPPRIKRRRAVGGSVSGRALSSQV